MIYTSPNQFFLDFKHHLIITFNQPSPSDFQYLSLIIPTKSSFCPYLLFLKKKFPILQQYTQ